MLMAVDVTFDQSCNRDSIDGAIDSLERDIVRAFPQTTRIFIEPENLADTQAGARRLAEGVAEAQG